MIKGRENIRKLIEILLQDIAIRNPCSDNNRLMFTTKPFVMQEDTPPEEESEAPAEEGGEEEGGEEETPAE